MSPIPLFINNETKHFLALNPYHIALTLIYGLGCKSIRQLLGICRKPEDLFAMSHAQLKEIFQNHHAIIADIESRRPLMLAEQQIPLMQGYGVDTLFCTEEEYPQRLNEAGCEDTPVLLYRIGRSDLNAKHTVAMVGSRKCTDYGRTTTRRLVQEMKTDNTTIVSGLAYGIDTTAHTAALDNGLPTVAVMGHGLDIVYPYQNRLLARKIVEQGGTLLSEYPVGTGINAAYFPARNRIVAALSDATIVVEAAERGGALITANMANSYHREVFAVPGRLGDPLSEGCNNLVIHNKAVMIRNAGDLFYQMGWKNTFDRQRQKEEQLAIFSSLSSSEQAVVQLLTDNNEMTMDEIVAKSGMPLPKIASIMMDLELKNVVRCLPGRLYKAN